MLHEARMNFQRTIVNRAPRFPCRGAAQFNLGLEVLRRDYGEATARIGRGWGGRLSAETSLFTETGLIRPGLAA